MSAWLSRIGAGLLAVTAWGCGSIAGPFDAHRKAPAPQVRECAAWYTALDHAVEQGARHDARAFRVPGFPYMRLDGILALLRSSAAASASATDAYAERLVALDLESRAFEIRNLPHWEPDAALARTHECARLLRELDLAKPERRAAILAAAQLPEYPPPLACAAPPAPAAASGRTGVVRYAPPRPAPMTRAEVATLLGQAHLDPLKQPLLSAAQFAELASLYAPSFDVAVRGHPDRFGALRWQADPHAPQVDASALAVYFAPAYARYGQRILLQLVYTVWFPQPLEAIAWRVTLGPDAEPLIYDSIHPCGCEHVFVPTARARLRAGADPADGRWPIGPALPRVGEAMRPVLFVAAGERRIERVELVRGADSLVRYELRPYDELRAMRMPAGGSRSAFGPDGRVPGSECRQWDWRSDDAALLERLFELDLAP